MRIGIICIGNEYQLDDGFGPAVARRLAAMFASGEDDGVERDAPVVEVLDRAVMGYAIVSDLMELDAAVVVDALDGTGEAPGTVLSFAPEDAAGSSGMASLHEVRFADVLASAQFMEARCQVARCFGVQVARMGEGVLERGLSPEVEAAVEPCARAVADYVAESFGAKPVEVC